MGTYTNYHIYVTKFAFGRTPSPAFIAFITNVYNIYVCIIIYMCMSIYFSSSAFFPDYLEFAIYIFYAHTSSAIITFNCIKLSLFDSLLLSSRFILIPSLTSVLSLLITCPNNLSLFSPTIDAKQILVHRNLFLMAIITPILHPSI